MAISYGNVDGTDFATGTGYGGGATVTKPSGTAENDLMLVLVSDNANGFAGTETPTIGGSAKTLIDSEFYNSTLTNNGVYGGASYWTAGGSEPSSYTVDISGAVDDAKCAIILTLSGHDSGTPIRAFATQTGRGINVTYPDT